MDYSPSAGATILPPPPNGPGPVAIDVFDDGEHVSFGAWQQADDQMWNIIAAFWIMPSAGEATFAFPDGSTAHDTLVGLYGEYGASLVTLFVDAVCASLSALPPVIAAPKPPPVIEPVTTADVVPALQGNYSIAQ